MVNSRHGEETFSAITTQKLMTLSGTSGVGHPQVKSSIDHLARDQIMMFCFLFSLFSL